MITLLYKLFYHYLQYFYKGFCFTEFIWECIFSIASSQRANAAFFRACLIWRSLHVMSFCNSLDNEYAHILINLVIPRVLCSYELSCQVLNIHLILSQIYVHYIGNYQAGNYQDSLFELSVSLTGKGIQ